MEAGDEKKTRYNIELQEAVRQVKANREMEAKYMTLEEMLQELSGEIPKNLREKILSEKDNEVLNCYLKMILQSNSVEEFMGLMS